MASDLETWVANFVTKLDDSDVDVQRGRTKVAEHAKPPRVVFVRERGDYDKPALSGGQESGSAKQTSILVRNDFLTVYVWGADEEATETLLDEVAKAAVRTEVARLRSTAIFAFDVPSQTTEGGGNNLHGDAVVMQLRLNWDIFDDLDNSALTTLTGVSHTCAVDTELGLPAFGDAFDDSFAIGTPGATVT